MDIPEHHHSSAAAFVQGGILDACEDSCSICLESFSESNPITVTSCKHGYHLQCILEWSQRSKDCPMCLQHFSLKDPTSQELLDAVEQERAVAWMPYRNSADGLEIHQTPALSDDSDFEERIMQHLAAAARAHQLARRRDSHSRERQPGVQDHPQLVVLPPHSSSQVSLVSGRVANGGEFSPFGAVGPPRERGSRQMDAATPRMARRWSDPVRGSELNRVGGAYLDRMESEQNTDSEQLDDSRQRTPPLETMSFSESLKSRFAAASSRYKETLTKTTRGFRERLRARNNTIDLGARAREVSAGLARALERMSVESSGKSQGESDVPTTSGGASEMEASECVEGSNTSESHSGEAIPNNTALPAPTPAG